MIRKIFVSSPWLQLSLARVRRPAFGFSGYEDKNQHSLFSNINESRNYRQLFDIYNKNKDQFSTYLYSVACRKICRLSRDRSVSREYKLSDSAQFRSFIDELCEKDLSNINPTEAKSMLFMLRNLYTIKPVDSRLYDPLKKKVIERMDELAKGGEFDLKDLVNVYYDYSCIQMCDPTFIIQQTLKIMEDNSPEASEQRDGLESYHLSIFLKGFSLKNSFYKADRLLLREFVKLISQKLDKISLSESIKILMALNQIRLNSSLSQQQFMFLKKMIEHVQQNIRELQVASIFSILTTPMTFEDELLKPLYDEIQDNIFLSITQDGTSFLEQNILFDCFKALSIKHNSVKRISIEQANLLLKYVKTSLDRNDRNISQYITRDIGLLMKEQFFQKETCYQIYKLITSYPNLDIHFKTLFELSIRRFDLQQVFNRIPNIKLENSVTWFIDMAVAIKLQNQINPNNEHINQLLKQVQQSLQKLTVQEIKVISFFKKSKSVKFFHNQFSDLYLPRLEPELTKRENFTVYLRYMTVAMDRRQFPIKLKLLDQNQVGLSLPILLRRTLEDQSQEECLSILTIIDNTFQAMIASKCWAAVLSSIRFMTSSPVLYYCQRNQNLCYKISDILTKIANILPQFDNQQKILSILLTNISLTRFKKVLNSHFFRSFLVKCRDQLPKLSNEIVIKKLINILFSNSLLPLEIAQKYGMPVAKIEGPEQIQKDNIVRFFRQRRRITQEESEVVLKLIDTLNVTATESILLSIEVDNSIQSIAVIQKCLRKLIRQVVKWNAFRYWGICQNLQKYFARRLEVYRDYIKTVARDAESNFKKYYQNEHAFIIKEASKCSIPIETYATKLAQAIISKDRPRERSFALAKVVVQTSNNYDERLFVKLQKIHPERILPLYLYSEKQIQNLEETIRAILDKVQAKGTRKINSFHAYYIAKKYPQMAELAMKLKRENQSFLLQHQPQLLQLYKHLEKDKGVKVTKQQFDKNNIYYEVQNLAIVRMNFNRYTKTTLQNINKLSTILGKKIVFTHSLKEVLKRICQVCPDIKASPEEILGKESEQRDEDIFDKESEQRDEDSQDKDTLTIQQQQLAE